MSTVSSSRSPKLSAMQTKDFSSTNIMAHKGRAAYRSWGWYAMAERVVLSQLKNLHTGCLVIIDGEHKHIFGEPLNPSDNLFAEMVINDKSCYADIMTNGSIGAAESYMMGDWVSPDLTMLVRVMVRNMDVLDELEGGLANLSRAFLKVLHKLNENTQKGSRRNIAAHYDLGNELFEHFLDPSMMYSSGIFPHENATMREASFHKLEVICQTLDLKPEDQVVEVGTGWGGFAIHAAMHYGCHVTTTTISENQYFLAKQRIDELGLNDKVTLLKSDYRKLEGSFDKLVSIEMIEAVGWQYYETFFKTCSGLLKPDGKMLIQAITIEDQRFEKAKRDVDFIQRYIFPGSCIPSIQALLTSSMKASDFRLVEQTDFAEHYAQTLYLWNKAFSENLESIDSLGYNKTFQRMWEFYLCYCEGGFRERAIGVSHLVFAKPQCRQDSQHNAFNEPS